MEKEVRMFYGITYINGHNTPLLMTSPPTAPAITATADAFWAFGTSRTPDGGAILQIYIGESDSYIFKFSGDNSNSISVRWPSGVNDTYNCSQIDDLIIRLLNTLS